MEVPTQITLLFTDVERSSTLIESVPDQYARALAGHNDLLRRICAARGGEEFHDAGDGLYFAFPECAQAVAAAGETQRALASHEWPSAAVELRVRMALHVCLCEYREQQYRGSGMHLNARLLAAAHGGQILCSESVREALADERISVLGTFHLRGLSGSHRISQIRWSETPPAFPPPRAAHARQHNLPVIADAFVGREREMRTLGEMLRDPTARLVTLEGRGGMGKTRLAIEAARTLLGVFDHAITFVALAGCPDPLLLPHTLADILGCAPESGGDPLEAVIGELTGYPSLLVLDSLEHLGDGINVSIGALLDRLPECHLFATSRRALGLRAERVLPLAPLPIEPGDANSDALDLLVARARGSSEDFAVTEANRTVLLAICRRLDGIPLALELAAARLDLLDPPGLLASLETGDAAEADEPLRQIIAWSVAHLPRDTQRVFRQLGVFRGGVTALAAREVCEIETPEQTLGHLHFLRQVRLLATRSEGRYTLPGTVRQWALDALPPEEKTATRNREIEFLIKAARRTGTKVGTPDERAAVDHFAPEMDNVIDALQHSRDLSRRLRLAIQCHYFSIFRGLAAVLRPFLPHPDCGELLDIDAKLAGQAWNAAGLLDQDAERLEDAAAEFLRAEQLFEQAGAAVFAISARLNFGIVAEMRDHYAEATASYEKALASYRAAGQIAEMVSTLINWAVCEKRLGSPARAVDMGEEALALVREHALSDGSLQATLATLSDLYLGHGNLTAARGCGVRALSLARTMGRTTKVVICLITLGQIAAAQEREREMSALCQEARKLVQATGLTLQRSIEEDLSILEKRARSSISRVRYLEESAP